MTRSFVTRSHDIAARSSRRVVTALREFFGLTVGGLTVGGLPVGGGQVEEVHVIIQSAA